MTARPLACAVRLLAAAAWLLLVVNLVRRLRGGAP